MPQQRARLASGAPGSASFEKGCQVDMSIEVDGQCATALGHQYAVLSSCVPPHDSVTAAAVHQDSATSDDQDLPCLKPLPCLRLYGTLLGCPTKQSPGHITTFLACRIIWPVELVTM
jgi:hypothetical protein